MSVLPHRWVISPPTWLCISSSLPNASCWIGSRWALFGKGREGTPWKFNSSPLKIYQPKRKGSSSNHHFSGAMLNFWGVNGWNLQKSPISNWKWSAPNLHDWLCSSRSSSRGVRWKSTVFYDRRYIFKWLSFHYVDSFEVILRVFRLG